MRAFVELRHAGLDSLGAESATATIAGGLIPRGPSWYNNPMEATPRTDEELREQAISQLKKKREDEIQREAQRLRG